MLTLRNEIRNQIVEHALNGLPNEACGLFAADVGDTVVHTFFPMENAAKSETIYQLNPLEHMRVESEADGKNIEIIGVMHSHTHTPAYPSPTDVKDAANQDPFGRWHYLIISLMGEEPSLRSFRIKDGQITEEEVVVTGDSNK